MRWIKIIYLFIYTKAKQTKNALTSSNNKVMIENLTNFRINVMSI